MPGKLIETGKPGASPGVTLPEIARFWSIRTTPSTAKAEGDAIDTRSDRNSETCERMRCMTFSQERGDDEGRPIPESGQDAGSQRRRVAAPSSSAPASDTSA